MAELPTTDINATALYLLIGRLERQVETGFKGVNDRFDKQEGRLENVVATVVEQGAQLAVLKDRSDHASSKADTAVETANQATPKALRWGIGVSSTVIAVIEIVKHYWSP